MDLPIETGRLVIREYCLSDLESVNQHRSDPDLVKYLPWGPETLVETKQYLARVIAYQEDMPRCGYEFAVVSKQNETLIGGVCLHIDNQKDRKAWIGYRIHKNYWGQGYATEATKAIIDFGFTQLNLHRIYATCDVLNLASAKVLQKCGMVKEGCLRQEMWQRGKWRDSFLFSILESE